jgi:phosphatidylinositol glycan class K
LKFQDHEELTSVELADAIEQMHQKQRYNEILLITDTCQAESMGSKLYSPNVISVASSKVGEDSLSHHGDPSIGVYVIDRYTYYALEFLESIDSNSNRTLSDFFAVCPRRQCISTVNAKTDLYRKDTAKVRLTDFFGNLPQAKLLHLPGLDHLLSV